MKILQHGLIENLAAIQSNINAQTPLLPAIFIWPDYIIGCPGSGIPAGMAT